MFTGQGNLRRAASRRQPGFTLLEMVVVIGIVTVLIGILIPGLTHSRRIAKQTACLTGLRQVGVGVSTYAMDNDGSIPYGPKAPPPSATNFYPKTGNVTSLISLKSGAPVGLGLLLDRHMTGAEESFFCPGADEKWDTKESLSLVGKAQVESSYYYRHASVSTISGPAVPPNVLLDRLGPNRKGKPIRCLAMDTQFKSSKTMALFNIHPRTHHNQEVVNAVYTDGHVLTHPNTNDRFKVNFSLSVYNTLDRILTLFEELDSE